jgi:hypothetical protein
MQREDKRKREGMKIVIADQLSSEQPLDKLKL